MIVRSDWATRAGEDEFGSWAEFDVPWANVEPITQRVRWVPPGRFQMGSPADEAGHVPREGPRHEEEIDRGFWLFDSPCTDGLWGAVMAGYPNHYHRDLRLPVVLESWDSCQEFLSRLNDKLEGIEFDLPSEVQWEYACRAGSEGACYGPLDEIAWHSENSAEELQPVKQKVPNRWGLYDMLGNVDEWCSDSWRDRYNDCPPVEAYRVIRGGSWKDLPLDLRAAFRDPLEPGWTDVNLGFRCCGLTPE